MSVRKTRRGGKGENITLNDIENTPVEVKRSSKKRKLDQSVQSDQLNESTRVTQRTRAKKLISDDENNKTVDESISFNVTKRRTRKAVNDKVAVIELDKIDDNQNEKEKKVKFPKPKRTRRTKKHCSTDEESAQSSSNEEHVNEVKKRPRTKLLQLKLQDINSPITTPECSPMVVNLTPHHRSFKTPKKSPLNIGSPKTHETLNKKLSKTPRKLSVVSDDSSKQGSPEENKKDDSAVKIKVEKEDNDNKTSPNSNSLNQSYERRSSKFPKIVLRVSKSPKKIKTPPAKSSKLKNSPANISKVLQISVEKMDSPVVISNEQLNKSVKKRTSSSKNISPKRSPKKIQLYEKVKTPKLILERIPLKLLSPNAKAVLETPVVTPTAMKLVSDVILSPKRPKSTSKTRSPITDSGTPLRPFPKPKRLSSPFPFKAIDIEEPIDQLDEPNISSPRDKIRRSLNLSPTTGPLSVPVHVSPVSVDQFYKSPSKFHKNSSMMLDDVTNPLISEDDDSFEISGIQHVDTSKGNETFTADKDEQKKSSDTYSLSNVSTLSSSSPIKKRKSLNDTYELDEPKTPALKRKRNTLENDEIIHVEEEKEPEQKKVRFAPNKTDVMLPLTSSTPAKNISFKKPIISYKNSPYPNKKLLYEKKEVSSNSGLKVPVVGIERMSMSSINKKASVENRRSIGSIKKLSKAQEESVNRLSRPRLSFHSDKKEVKTLSAKKIPNFAEIHQKKFAAMESILDAKKKVTNRHRALFSTPASNQKTTSNPAETTNGRYNRFGYKVIRKDDAVNLVNKKLSMKLMEDKKSESRLVLKGIRTNRRFELQMKMRNLKP